MKPFPPLSTGDITSYSIHDRKSKVKRTDFARPWTTGRSLAEFLDRLPNILAAGDLVESATRWAGAVSGDRTVILAMGGHPVKVGLAPVIIDLMQRGAIHMLAVNGSVMVHDTEIAMVGATSEDVAAGLGSGDFGMGREANELINQAAAQASKDNIGLGEALGRAIVEGGYEYARDSVFASAYQLGIPVTVHVALGTDVYHIHPQAVGADIGQAGFNDFHLFTRAVATLEQGVFINLGSAVIIPEVFLKAVTLVRNLGYSLSGLTTINMDFLRQYRPTVNVVQRPTAQGGRGIYLIGHHEIMFPLLSAAVIEKLEEPTAP